MYNLPVFWEQRGTGYRWTTVMADAETRRKTVEVKRGSKPEWRLIQENFGVWHQELWVWGLREPLRGSNECHPCSYLISNPIEEWDVRVCWWRTEQSHFWQSWFWGWISLSSHWTLEGSGRSLPTRATLRGVVTEHTYPLRSREEEGLWHKFTLLGYSFPIERGKCVILMLSPPNTETRRKQEESLLPKRNFFE